MSKENDRIVELEEALKRIRERAERVLEGEDWDLAGYCEEIIAGLSIDKELKE